MAKFCPECGKKLSFFASGGLCRDCEAVRQAGAHAKKCPYCGQLLNNAAFKCTRCKKWVDNELFHKLSADDTKLIKDKDLTPFTPSLLVAMATPILNDGSLEKRLEKIDGRKLNKSQRFNLSVFESFCFLTAISLSVRMKQGCRQSIEGDLILILLKRAATEHEGKAGSLTELFFERGIPLFEKFQDAWHKIPLEATPSSQMEASNAFGVIVFADESPISFTGLSLYTHFMVSLEAMREAFSKIFLVEEDDFDWRAIVDAK